MTMPSSTSQSSLLDPLGVTVSSFGPQMQVVTLLKMIGLGDRHAGLGRVVE